MERSRLHSEASTCSNSPTLRRVALDGFSKGADFRSSSFDGLLSSSSTMSPMSSEAGGSMVRRSHSLTGTETEGSTEDWMSDCLEGSSSSLSLDYTEHETLEGVLMALRTASSNSPQAVNGHEFPPSPSNRVGEYHPTANMDPGMHLEDLGKRSGWLVDKSEIKLRNAPVIGEGTVGTVFRSRFRERTVAIKVLKHDDERSSEELAACIEDLRQEVRIASMVEHPNIIRFYGATLQEREPMIIYEYMASGTIEDFYHARREEMASRRSWMTVPENAVKKAWRPALSLALKWCQDLMAGLAYLHSNKHKIIHRDIKPSNLFLNHADGSLKIGDLGLCTFAEKKGAPRKMTGMTGSMRYMAPEVYNKVPYYNEAVDVFSAGLVMFFICTGQRPYDHLASFNANHIIAGVVQGRLRPQLQTKGTRDVPKLQDILTECWHGDALKRPAAADVAKELQEMAEDPEQLVLKKSKSFSSKVNKLLRSSSSIFKRSRSSSTELSQSV